MAALKVELKVAMLVEKLAVLKVSMMVYKWAAMMVAK
jgi:hypothetical protein